MARLIVIFDPDARVELPPAGDHCTRNLRCSLLDIADDLGDRDIYEIARRLAELLLEQL